MVATAVLILIVGASLVIVSGAAAQGGRPAAPVEVTNPLPLPVTGNVGIVGTPNANVSNMPTVEAKQSGSWSVNVIGNNATQYEFMTIFAAACFAFGHCGSGVS